MVELEKRSDRSALQAEITSLKQAVSEADLDSKTAAEDAEKSKQEAASLKEEIEKVQLRVLSATEAEEAAKSKLDAVESTLAEKNEQIESLRREVAAQSDLSDVVSSQKTEILGLSESLSSVKKGQEAVQQELDNANQQLQESHRRIEELNSASVAADQQLQKTERDLKNLQQEKASLEQLVERLKSESEQAKLEDQSAEAKILIEKNELLSKQVGHLESASKYSQSAKEELKEVISVQKQRIGELETSVGSARDMAARQSAAVAQANAALLKIEAALAEQTKRINAMEDANRLSLAKIAQLQAAASKRPSSGRKSKLSKGAGQLSEVNGIGPKYQKKLTDLGVKTIKEIAEWSNDDIEKFADKLGCGKTMTNDWREKAQDLIRK